MLWRMEDHAGHLAPPWRAGDRLLLDQGRREVIVEDSVAGQVCCRWIENGAPRKSWIPAERLQPMPPRPDRLIVPS